MEKDSLLNKLLPPEFSGWNSEELIEINVKEKLYELINGGAELYISYGFKEAVSRTYKLEAQSEIQVEIYDMGEAKNAFGVFTHNRYKEESDYGQGSNRLPGALFFWKDKYYVSIMTIEETEESKKLINTLGTHISERIENDGKLPVILNYLPEKDQMKAGFIYFRHYIWLNTFHFIADTNILQIDETTDAIMAKYSTDEQITYLLLIEYPDSDRATGAFKSFNTFYYEGIEGTKPVQDEDNSWSFVKYNENMIIGVFHANTSEYAISLLEATKKKVNLE